MILALDIGATCGWARSDGACGYAKFKFDDHGRALANFSDWLAQMLDMQPLITLAIERPFGSAAFTHRLTMLMEGVAHMEAYVRDIPRTDRSAGQVRKWLLGHATLPNVPGVSKKRRDAEMDKLVLAAVRARGFRPDSEHAADAAAVICMLEQRAPLGSGCLN